MQGSTIAGKNLTGSGANVVIDSATDTYNTTHSETTSSKGITLGLSGSIGDAINGTYQQAQAARSGAGDSRATALHAIAAAGDVAIGVASVTGGALAGKGAPSIGVQVGVGSSHSRLDTSENQTTQHGSSVSSGGATSLIATGDNTPGSGNLTVAGSNVSGNGVVLAAKNRIDLQNTTDTDSTRSSNSSSSASVRSLSRAQSMAAHGHGRRLHQRVRLGDERHRADCCRAGLSAEPFFAERLDHRRPFLHSREVIGKVPWQRDAHHDRPRQHDK